MSRKEDIDRFYELLGLVQERIGGERYLRDCDGYMDWPKQGVYFFFEPGETREDSSMSRVVRIGTHAVSAGSKTTLWNRLSQHRGTKDGRHPGGGNHRGSIFRLHVGSALLDRGDYPEAVRESWVVRGSAPRDVREREYVVEKAVSEYIGNMPFLWVKAEDAAGTDSVRSYLECNAIELLSNANKQSIDPPSSDWLGHCCWNQAVRESGLWNVKHVYDAYEPRFLEDFERLVQQYMN